MAPKPTDPLTTTGLGPDYSSMEVMNTPMLDRRAQYAGTGSSRSSLVFLGSIRQSIRRQSLLLEVEAAALAAEETGDKTKTKPPPHSSYADVFKYTASLALLLFSLVVVIGLMVTRQTVGTADDGIAPVVALVVTGLLLNWLATMEGGQGALVGLQPIERHMYQDTHRVTTQVTGLVHEGKELERFIVGRQFLVVLVIFGINFMASASPEASLLGGGNNEALHVLDMIFVESGLALILTTLILGQLVAQVNAAECMLDFVNNTLMFVSTRLALAIETLGLLHCTYLVQRVLLLFTGNSNNDDDTIDEEPQKEESNNKTTSILESTFFWLRVLLSLALLGFAFAVTLSAMFRGLTTAWEGMPAWASVLLFLGLMSFVGIMEGMQIALFAVINVPEDLLRRQSHEAHRNCQTIFAGDNMQAFLIGRQICVTVCTFVIARISTINVEDGEDNVLGVSDTMQAFFNTGLLGAVITTILGSLMWRIIGSSFPVAFLSNPLIAIIIRLCLLLELSGVCSSAWVLARFVKMLFKYEPDDVYLDGGEQLQVDDEEPTIDTERGAGLSRRSSVRELGIDRIFIGSSMRSSIASIQSELSAKGLV